jgi:hypothetical protein
LLVRGIVESARVYPFAVLDLFLYPFPWDHANDVYHLGLALLTVVGAASWLPPNRWRFSVLFAVFYLGMLVVLPMQDTRYLMPLAPLVLYWSALGIAKMAATLARLTRRALVPPAAERIALVTLTVIVLAALTKQIAEPPPLPLMETPGVRPLFSRLRATRDSSAIRVLFMNPRVLTWETGIPAMGFFLANPDTTLAELRAKRITHVVVGDVDTDPKRARSIRSAVATRPDAFRRLYAEGVFTVYAFDSTRARNP